MILVPNCLFIPDTKSRTPCRPRKVFSPQTKLSMPSAWAAFFSAASFSLLPGAAAAHAESKPQSSGAIARTVASNAEIRIVAGDL